MKLAGLKSVDGAHEESIWAAAWAPAVDHRPTAVLLTGALDETVRAWLPDDLTALGSPARGHALGVVSLAAHPAGALAAAVSLDSFIRVFDVDTGASVATLEAPPSEVWGVQFHPKVLIFAEPPLPVPAPVPGPAPSAGSNPTPGASPPLGPSPQHTWPAHPTYPTQQYVWPPPPQSQGYSSWPQAPTQQGPRPPYWQYEAAPQSGWTQLQPGWTQPQPGWSPSDQGEGSETPGDGATS